MADQEQFAGLSGDRNPMHVDPIAARRTQAGAVVAHGVHAALWALDVLAEHGRIAKPITAVDVRFAKFVYLGTPVELQVARATESSLQVHLVSGDLLTVTLDVGFTGGRPAVASLAVDDVPLPTAPLAFDVADLSHRSGRLALTAGRPAARLFAHAARNLGADRIQAIAQISGLVGMICPGFHSISSRYNVAIAAEPEEANGLGFRVTRVQKRVRMVELEIEGSGIAGTVTAFVRRPPVEQPRLADLAGVVRKDEFAGISALVIGGSRGLGAVTARAIVAGGGRVVITYAVGDADAREVATETNPAACRVLRYDVREDAQSQLADLPWDFNQLYYFATPQIHRQKSERYDRVRFAEFAQFYVDGFKALCSAVRAGSSGPVAVFYPSSTAVEERPPTLGEYVAAKAAGELLCADVNRSAGGLRVIVKRLPPVLTDQTATVLPSATAAALDVILPVVREMAATRSQD
jgi:NADP-dependent 3-hydroxy acid dehydrogenase YdfG